LVVHTNTMLSVSIPVQGLKPVAWGHLEFMEGRDGVQLIEFAGGNLPQRLGAGAPGYLGPSSVEDIFCACVFE